MTAASVKRELRRLGDPKKAAFHRRFFKTGPGEYAEGDRFVGVRYAIERFPKMTRVRHLKGKI